MRVAFLVSAFPSISETFILDQITGLGERGCEVEIFAAEPELPSAFHPEVEAFGLMERRFVSEMPPSYVRRPFRAAALALSGRGRLAWPHLRSLNIRRYCLQAASLRLFFETAACAGRLPFDVVHCHFGPNGLRGSTLREIGALQGKLVTSFYGYDISELPRQRRRNPYTQLFAKGDLFIAISQSMRERLIELGCDPARIIVHPLGVDPRLFHGTRHTAPGGPVRILTIGRMVPKKGIEYGLRAVAELVKRMAHVEYLIVGDGPLRVSIEKMVNDLGLQDVVRLAGWQTRPEVLSTLSTTDILLTPSVTSESGDMEGTPVVIMEAMACGVPVVSTIHAGIPEIVQDGFSGYLVPERDVKGLAGALTRLILNPELRASMGQNGRAAIEERHDINKLNDRLVGIYRGIAAPTA